MQTRFSITSDRVFGKPNRGFWPGLSLFSFLVLIVVLTVVQTAPPEPVPASAPAHQFSAERAMADVQTIAAEPHANGTPEHDKVRDYIVSEITKLGLVPDLQKTTAVTQSASLPFDRAATTQNILARVKGTDGKEKAVLLMTHYSSSLHTYGADDAVSTAALLETMKNLQESAPLQRDVIFLFTDAKDPLPVGSQAFVDEHPWAKQVAYAFNFDARGAGGPVVMFETSEGNAGLIEGMAKAVPTPLANSLLYTMYKMTNLDTDLTMIKQDKNVQALNFAFAENSRHFRNMSDKVQNLDPRSLQQTGEYALGLARHFGNLPETVKDSGNAVFFNLMSWAFLHYPTSWVLPLTLLIVVAFISVLVYGLRRGQLTMARTWLGFAWFLLAVALTAGGGFLIGMLVSLVTNPFTLIAHELIWSVAFVALALAILAALYSFFLRKWGVHAATAGMALGWLVILLAVSVLAPAGSYLFAWPLLANVIALYILLRKGEAPSAWNLALLSLLALPALLLGTQFIDLVHMLLTLGVPLVIMVLIGLMMTALVPQLSYLFTATRRWQVAGASAALFVVLFAVGALLPSYDKENPKPHTLLYGVDLDANKANWYTADGYVDAFTSTYLTKPETSNIAPFYPQSVDWDTSFLRTEAPVANVSAPLLKVVDDKVVGTVRRLHLHVSSPQQPWYTMISMTSDQALDVAVLNGKTIRNRDTEPKRWEIAYYALPSGGADLVVMLTPEQSLQVRLADGRDGLPAEFNVKRPAEYVPTYFSDSTYVSKLYNIPAAK